MRETRRNAQRANDDEPDHIGGGKCVAKMDAHVGSRRHIPGRALVVGLVGKADGCDEVEPRVVQGSVALAASDVAAVAHERSEREVEQAATADENEEAGASARRSRTHAKLGRESGPGVPGAGACTSRPRTGSRVATGLGRSTSERRCGPKW